MDVLGTPTHPEAAPRNGESLAEKQEIIKRQVGSSEDKKRHKNCRVVYQSFCDMKKFGFEVSL